MPTASSGCATAKWSPSSGPSTRRRRTEMRVSDFLATGTRNMGRRKVRTVLTSIGVWVGILTIVTMVSAGVAAQNQITDTIKQLGLETVFVSPQFPESGPGNFAG